MTDCALSLEKISKSFGDVRAVDSLSARLPAGCIYGFLGPNGAGKTTTIRMITDIIHPDSGEIVILGETAIERVWHRIGYMPEERGLYRKMKVRKILSYLGALKGMKGEALSRAISRWLEELGLADKADNKVEALSRGMQQKLQFIATVINDPELVILDEPFSGLDPINLDLIQGIMTRLREAGRTVIFSTHMMEQAEKLCDYILLVNRGRKICDGTLDEIRERYRTNQVVVELEGDTGFVGELPLVKGSKKDGRSLEITLEDGADQQELLMALVGRARVNAFQVKVPSLHEIFVHLVGESNG